MSMFSKLHPDIITFHILPRLDGQTLIVLSSVSSQFRRLICNNNNSDLWRNICTTTWPSLLMDYPSQFLFQVIFTGGYRGFFSDAFPSIHPFKIPHHHPHPRHLEDRVFYYATDIFLLDEPQPKPLYSLLTSDLIHCGYFRSGLYHTKRNKNFIPVKKEGFAEYLEEKLTLSFVVIDPQRKCAASLFSFGCKPVSVEQFSIRSIMVVYETVLPGLSNLYTEMVKCQVSVFCAWEYGTGEDRFYVLNDVYVKMNDMNGKSLRGRHAAVVIRNAIGNAERKKNQNNY